MKRAWAKSTKDDVNLNASSMSTYRYSIIYQIYLRVKRFQPILVVVLLIGSVQYALCQPVKNNRTEPEVKQTLEIDTSYLAIPMRSTALSTANEQ